MKILNSLEEAKNLELLFKNINKSQFCKKHEIPGGASMLSQHISGHRTIGLDAGIAYAKSLEITLDKISPRLYLEGMKLLEVLNLDEFKQFFYDNKNKQSLTNLENELLVYFRNLKTERKKFEILGYIKGEADRDNKSFSSSTADSIQKKKA